MPCCVGWLELVVCFCMLTGLVTLIHLSEVESLNSPPISSFTLGCRATGPNIHMLTRTRMTKQFSAMTAQKTTHRFRATASVNATLCNAAAQVKQGCTGPSDTWLHHHDLLM